MDAISTYKVFLMYKPTSSASYEKLVDIKSFPDLGGDPEMLDTTTLSDNIRTNILGIQELDSLQFTTNYNKTDYTKLKGLEGSTQHLAVWFGGTESVGTLTPTGSDGKWMFDGELVVYANGGGVNEVVNMTISVAASTPITVDSST